MAFTPATYVNLVAHLQPHRIPSADNRNRAYHANPDRSERMKSW